MSWEIQFSIIVVALMALFLSGVPVAFSMAILGFVGLLVWAGPDVALNAVTALFHQTPRKYLLTAIPTFILMAHLLRVSGVAERLFLGLSRSFAGFPAGLAVACNAAATFFAAVTGASVASCAALAPIAMEEMVEKRNYDKRFAVGCVGGGGGLAIIIPPSVAFIVFAMVAETSVVKLFIAGIIPGLILSLGYTIVILVWAWWDKKVAPPMPSAPWKARARGLVETVPVIILAAGMLGFIYLGVGTPTEAAAFGTVGALIMMIVYGKLNWARVQEAIVQTMVETGLILFIIVGAFVFSFLLTYLRLPQQLAASAVGAGTSPFVILLMVNVVLLVLGCLMDTTSLLVVAVPIMLPMLLSAGYTDLTWLGVVLTLNVEMGLTTPPVGLNLFVLAGSCKKWGVTLGDVTTGCAPFLIAAGAVLVLVMVFPVLTRIL